MKYAARNTSERNRMPPPMYGGVPVPYTVSWTGEESFHVEDCAFFHRPAICQAVAAGIGKPRFGSPHCQRQREAIARDLCDTCGRPLASRTKVSLSHARPVPHGAEGLAILQVEPLLHRECAALSLRYCPSLKRDIAAGTLTIRQVHRSRAQAAIMSAEYVKSFTGIEVKALGHAKVELMKWTDRDATWLEGVAA